MRLEIRRRGGLVVTMLFPFGEIPSTETPYGFYIRDAATDARAVEHREFPPVPN